MTRFDRWGAVLGWGLLPFLVFIQTADQRRSIFQPRIDLISIDLVVYAAITLVLLPWTLRGLRQLRREAIWVLFFFLALVCYAFVRSLLDPPPILSGIVVQRPYLVAPNLMALLSMTTAMSFIATMPPHLRRAQLWGASVLIVASSYATWPIHANLSGSTRLAGTLGGAAVIYAALLLAFAVFLACAIEGYLRVWSSVGAFAAAAAILLSGSRAGLVCSGAFVLVAGIGQLRGRSIPRWIWWALGAAGVAFAAFLTFFPEASHLLSTQDELRRTNAGTSWRAWTESWVSIVFGQGSGRVWPWYPFEAGYFDLMPRLIWTDWGEALPHPHSTYFLITVELGLAGLVLLLLAIGSTWFCLWRTRRERATYLAVAAVSVSVLGWFFDTFLFRNYPLALCWWMTLISVVGFGSLGKPTTKVTDVQFSAESAAS